MSGFFSVMLNFRCLETSKDVKQVTRYMGCATHFLSLPPDLPPPCLQPWEGDLHQQNFLCLWLQIRLVQWGTLAGDQKRKRSDFCLCFLGFIPASLLCKGCVPEPKVTALIRHLPLQALSFQVLAAFLLITEHCSTSFNFLVSCLHT